MLFQQLFKTVLDIIGTFLFSQCEVDKNICIHRENGLMDWIWYLFAKKGM